MHITWKYDTNTVTDIIKLVESLFHWLKLFTFERTEMHLQSSFHSQYAYNCTCVKTFWPQQYHLYCYLQKAIASAGYCLWFLSSMSQCI